MGKLSVNDELSIWGLVLFLIYQIWIPYGIWYLIGLLAWNTEITLPLWTLIMVIRVGFLWPLLAEWLDNR